MTDTARPGRQTGAGNAASSASAASHPPLPHCPVRLMKSGSGTRPGDLWLEYDEEVEVYSEAKPGTLEKQSPLPGAAAETVATLGAAKVTKKQPRRHYDYQPGFHAFRKLLEMVYAQAAEVAQGRKARQELDGLKAALEETNRKRGKS